MAFRRRGAAGMNILASFAPFLAFAVLIHFGLTLAALWAGAVVAMGLLLRDRLLLGRSAKLLEIGTVVLFAGLALYTTATAQAWSIPAVRLVVDAGLLAIVLVSLAIGQPFTMQYAKEEAPPEVWSSPAFRTVNQEITLAWAGAFAVLVVADAIMVFLPQVPHGLGVLLTVAALYGAVRFTRMRAGQAAPAQRRSG